MVKLFFVTCTRNESLIGIISNESVLMYDKFDVNFILDVNKTKLDSGAILFFSYGQAVACRDKIVSIADDLKPEHNTQFDVSSHVFEQCFADKLLNTPYVI